MSAQVPVDTIDTIRFVLDGETIELRDVDPTRTVLEFLREDLRRTGTKEGCAEGDCGACTVAIAELTSTGDDLVVRAVNACIQFLPTLDGKELITVESLSRPGEALHPVQRAMVDCHGSQCGFCTPGFVMSLLALYKSNPEPSRRDVDDALAGNLCRCTGYRPIIDAADAMYGIDDAEEDWLRQSVRTASAPAKRVERLRNLTHGKAVALSTSGRRYYAPATIDELAAVVAAYPDATLLAGGTDVGLWVTKQHRELATIIYTGRVRELRELVVTDSHIEVGAAVSFTDAMPPIVEHYPEFEELLLRFASPPIRNVATLGGNIANGSPIGDSMPLLVAAGTSLVLCSAEGRRELQLEDFYHDYMVNDLHAAEFVACVRIPLPQDDTVYAGYKVSKRFDQDISAVCAGLAVQRSADGARVEAARIAYGGLAATVKRAPACEAALTGAAWNTTTIAAAKAALPKDFAPISDMRSSASYRLRVAQNLLERFFRSTQDGDQVTVYDYGRAS